MAVNFTLVIGNKNYSSWSLRPWLAMKYFKIPFKEVLVPLYEGDYRQKILKYSPAGKVPALVSENVVVWDSLSICEFLAETFPKKNLWPKEKKARAAARSVCAEMHSGFTALRKNCPMDVRAVKAAFNIPADAKKDANRIITIWENCQRQFGKNGEFLFGDFTIADAFYAPIVWRFNTYGVKFSGVAKQYFNLMLQLPEMKEWKSAAQKEPWVIEH